MRRNDDVGLLWLGTAACLAAAMVLTILDRAPFARVVLFGGMIAGTILLWIDRRKRGSRDQPRDGSPQGGASWIFSVAGVIGLVVGVVLALTSATRVGVWLGFMFGGVASFICAVVGARIERRG